MAVFPIEYRHNDTALFVVVKVTKGIYVRCLCVFDTEIAYVLNYSRHYNNSIHGTKARQALSDFGFTLISDDMLAYQNWLYDARMFSNRI